jgi:hypothetical protein
MVLCPAYAPPVRECTKGLDELLDRGFRVVVKHDSPNVDIARALAAKEALEDERNEWILWVDADMGFNAAQFDQLASARDEFVAGLYYLPKVGRLAANFASRRVTVGPRGKLERASGVGLGFALTHRRVYERLDGPYPSPEWWRVPLCRYNGGLLRPYFGSPVVPPSPDQEHPSLWGDDLGFSQRVLASGGTIWCDTRVFVDHVGRKVYGLEDAARALQSTIQAPSTQ